MRKLSFNKVVYEAERIVKTDTDIIGYNGNNETFAFRGISDFNEFVIDGEFDVEFDELAALRADNEKLKTENETLKNRVSDVEMTLTEILFS